MRQKKGQGLKTILSMILIITIAVILLFVIIRTSPIGHQLMAKLAELSPFG